MLKLRWRQESAEFVLGLILSFFFIKATFIALHAQADQYILMVPGKYKICNFLQVFVAVCVARKAFAHLNKLLQNLEKVPKCKVQIHTNTDTKMLV